MSGFPEKLETFLKEHERRRVSASGRDAAVLITLRQIQEEWSFLLTRRTNRVPTHKGQISFPGGFREGGDRSLGETACRETCEELGIRLENLHLVGRFNDFQAITGHRVATFAGILDSNVRPVPQQGEVAYILDVPVSFFQKTSPAVKIRRRLGKRVPVYYYHFGREVIWGLTAWIVREFLEALGPDEVC